MYVWLEIAKPGKWSNIPHASQSHYITQLLGPGLTGKGIFAWWLNHSKFTKALNLARNLSTFELVVWEARKISLQLQKRRYINAQTVTLQSFSCFLTFVFSSAVRGSLRCSSLSISRNFLRSFLTFRSTSVFSDSAIICKTACSVLVPWRQEKQNLLRSDQNVSNRRFKQTFQALSASVSQQI